MPCFLMDLRFATGREQKNAELEDPQVALRLLRACAGHTRLLHSMRCNPPQPQQAALEHFDDLVRTCFSSFTGLHLEQTQWLQATRGLSQAGLGLRSTSLDAAAAYLASVGGSAARCSAVDAHIGVASASPLVLAALGAYNQSIPVPMTVDAVLAQRQKTLVGQMDLAAWNLQLDRASPTQKALLAVRSSAGWSHLPCCHPSGPQAYGASRVHC